MLCASVGWGSAQGWHEQKFEIGHQALQKIIALRDQLKRQLAELESKKKFHEKDRKELLAVLQSIERVLPYGSGDVCDQTQTLLNKLYFLEQENQNIHSGVWLVSNEKASMRLMLVIGVVFALNVAIWGAVKMYYCLRDREHKAGSEQGDLQGVLGFVRNTIAQNNQRVRGLEAERGRLLRRVGINQQNLRTIHQNL